MKIKNILNSNLKIILLIISSQLISICVNFFMVYNIINFNIYSVIDIILLIIFMLIVFLDCTNRFKLYMNLEKISDSICEAKILEIHIDNDNMKLFNAYDLQIMMIRYLKIKKDDIRKVEFYKTKNSNEIIMRYIKNDNKTTN